MKIAFIFTLVICFLPLSFAANPDFDKAAKEIRYLKPSEVKQFPDAVKTALQSESCLIPVVQGAQGPTGWAKGTFAEKGQMDWAVLCSNAGTSKVKVVWGGKNKPCPDSFGATEDRTFLQVQDAAGTVTFGRMVGTIEPRKVVAYLKRSGAPTPSNLSQDGIVDAFVGKASTVHLCTSGKWQEIPGAD